jgi:hypothetical protein
MMSANELDDLRDRVAAADEAEARHVREWQNAIVEWETKHAEVIRYRDAMEARAEAAEAEVKRLTERLERANAAEVKRLTECLERANAGFQKHERLYYLEADKLNFAEDFGCGTCGVRDGRRIEGASRDRRLRKGEAMIDPKPTERGFMRVDFLDEYDRPCSIQESSFANERMLWLGCNEGTHHHVTGECLARMHLTREQVAALLPHLTRFVETGRLT